MTVSLVVYKHSEEVLKPVKESVAATNVEEFDYE